MQAFLPNQIGAHAREFALRHMAHALKQQVGHRQIEHRVAQKLQTLVVLSRMAAMRQRLLQQSGGVEHMLQALLQRHQVCTGGRRF